MRPTAERLNIKLTQTDGKPYKKIYDPRKMLRDGEASMVERLQEAFEDLGAVGNLSPQVCATSALEDKLKSEIQETHWDALSLHAERGRLIVVSEKLDLLTAALAVAEDRTTDVETFLTAGLLRKAGEADIVAYNQEDNPNCFVIVLPFVLSSRLVG